jgi:hypothetical protein
MATDQKRGGGFAVGWLLLTASAAYPQDVPTTGLVYNTKDRASLLYECEREDETLSCSFTQVGVRQKMTAEDLHKRLAEAAKRKVEAPEPELCSNVLRYIEAVEGRAPMPKDFVPPKNESEKADTLRTMKAVRLYCATPNRENAIAVERASHDPDTRTCLVRSHTFKQTFTLVSDASSKKSSWVVRASPSGACGTVQLDRFEPETLPYAPEWKQWKYVARKAVTNPEGIAFPGVKCSELDEEVYTYTSDITQNKRPGICDYIEFTVL